MKHISIICTKDRPNEVNQLIDNLLRLDKKFDKILIIDGSKLNTLKNSHKRNKTIQYARTLSGLTFQRNQGKKILVDEYDYYHFFDDDVCVKKKYLIEFENYLYELRELDVATGRQVGKFNKKYLFILRSLKIIGTILKNGMNITPDYLNLNRVELLQWIPGCNMIFSRRVFLDPVFIFDEINRSGYSMGEDVDISLKLKDYKKYYLPKCEYIHYLSDNNRQKSEAQYYSYLTHRHRLTLDFREQFNPKLFIFSLYLEMYLFRVAYYLSFKEKFFIKSYYIKKFISNKK